MSFLSPFTATYCRKFAGAPMQDNAENKRVISPSNSGVYSRTTPTTHQHRNYPFHYRRRRLVIIVFVLFIIFFIFNIMRYEYPRHKINGTRENLRVTNSNSSKVINQESPQERYERYEYASIAYEYWTGRIAESRQRDSQPTATSQKTDNVICDNSVDDGGSGVTTGDSSEWDIASGIIKRDHLTAEKLKKRHFLDYDGRDFIPHHEALMGEYIRDQMGFDFASHEEKRKNLSVNSFSMEDITDDTFIIPPHQYGDRSADRGNIKSKEAYDSSRPPFSAHEHKRTTQLQKKRRKSSTAFPWKKVYIAANLYNNEEILSDFIASLTAFIERGLLGMSGEKAMRNYNFDFSHLYLKPSDIFVSIYSNANKDHTPHLIHDVMKRELINIGVRWEAARRDKDSKKGNDKGNSADQRIGYHLVPQGAPFCGGIRMGNLKDAKGISSKPSSLSPVQYCRDNSTYKSSNNNKADRHGTNYRMDYYKPSVMKRIPWLACVRNSAMLPLYVKGTRGLFPQESDEGMSCKTAGCENYKVNEKENVGIPTSSRSLEQRHNDLLFEYNLWRKTYSLTDNYHDDFDSFIEHYSLNKYQFQEMWYENQRVNMSTLNQNSIHPKHQQRQVDHSVPGQYITTPHKYSNVHISFADRQRFAEIDPFSIKQPSPFSNPEISSGTPQLLPKILRRVTRDWWDSLDSVGPFPHMTRDTKMKSTMNDCDSCKSGGEYSDTEDDDVLVLFFNDIYFYPWQINYLITPPSTTTFVVEGKGNSAQQLKGDPSQPPSNKDNPENNDLRHKTIVTKNTQSHNYTLAIDYGNRFDMSCAMDFYINLYDTWVMRGADGRAVSPYAPYVYDTEGKQAMNKVLRFGGRYAALKESGESRLMFRSRAALQDKMHNDSTNAYKNLGFIDSEGVTKVTDPQSKGPVQYNIDMPVVPVRSCWNGVTAIRASFFTRKGLRFRYLSPKEQRQCPESECMLICKDIIRIRRKEERRSIQQRQQDQCGNPQFSKETVDKEKTENPDVALMKESIGTVQENKWRMKSHNSPCSASPADGQYPLINPHPALIHINPFVQVSYIRELFAMYQGEEVITTLENSETYPQSGEVGVETLVLQPLPDRIFVPSLWGVKAIVKRFIASGAFFSLMYWIRFSVWFPIIPAFFVQRFENGDIEKLTSPDEGLSGEMSSRSVLYFSSTLSTVDHFYAHHHNRTSNYLSDSATSDVSTISFHSDPPLSPLPYFVSWTDPSVLSAMLDPTWMECVRNTNTTSLRAVLSQISVMIFVLIVLLCWRFRGCSRLRSTHNVIHQEGTRGLVLRTVYKMLDFGRNIYTTFIGILGRIASVLRLSILWGRKYCFLRHPQTPSEK